MDFLLVLCCEDTWSAATVGEGGSPAFSDLSFNNRFWHAPINSAAVNIKVGCFAYIIRILPRYEAKTKVIFRQSYTLRSTRGYCSSEMAMRCVGCPE